MPAIYSIVTTNGGHGPPYNLYCHFDRAQRVEKSQTPDDHAHPRSLGFARDDSRKGYARVSIAGHLDVMGFTEMVDEKVPQGVDHMVVDTIFFRQFTILATG